MPANIVKNVKRYWHIHVHMVLEGHVDMNALRAYGIRTSADANAGPFHAVANEHWEKMRTKLNETTSIRNLKQWANNNYPKGNPIDRIKLGVYDLATCADVIKRVGERQQLQRHLAGINPMPNREAPVPNNLPDACIPITPGSTTDLNLYSDPDGTSEDAKIAREVLRCVNQWKRSLTDDKEGTRIQARLILSILRKRSGLLVENGPYWDHFRSELRRINSDTSEYADNFARGAYAAVFKDLAGMDVEPHHLLGFNPFRLFKSALEDILATKEGIVIDKIVKFIAAMSKTILSTVKNSEDLMTEVANLAAEKKISAYYTEKGVRVENGEDCFGGPNCKFCPHKILRRLLSDLHHDGVEGMEKKKEIPGKEPHDYSKKDLESQGRVLKLICKFFHRIVTDLDKKYPKTDGSSHKCVPEDYEYESLDSSMSFLQTAIVKALFQFLQSLDSHKQCMVGMDPETFKRFFNAFDLHHITASANVLVPTGDKNLIIQTRKTFEFAWMKDLVSDKTFRSIFRAVAFETLKVRPLEVQDHALWHFLYTYRDEPPLKPLFGTYWPFVEDDDRNLILKGDIDATMEKMGLSASDVKSACDSDGCCGVTLGNEFLEAVDRVKDINLRARQKRAKRAGGDTGEENEEDADMVDGNKSGEGVSTTAGSVAAGSEEDAVMADVDIVTAATVPVEKEEDVHMTEDDTKGEGVSSTTGSVAAEENDDEEDEYMQDVFGGDEGDEGDEEALIDDDEGARIEGLSEKDLNFILGVIKHCEDIGFDVDTYEYHRPHPHWLPDGIPFDNEVGDDRVDDDEVDDDEGGDDNEVVDEEGDVNEGDGSNSARGYNQNDFGRTVYVSGRFGNERIFPPYKNPKKKS